MSNNIHEIFKKIILKEEPAEIIYEDEKVIAILDKFPVNPGHFLVIPKVHSTNLKSIDEDTLSYLIKIAVKLAKDKVQKQEFEDFKLIVNNGPKAGQVIYHTHVHIIPYYN